jgi:hypothetical protein
MNRATLLVLAALLAPGPALAQGLFEDAVAGEVDAGEPAVDSDGGEGFVLPETLELGGYVRGDLFVGKDEGVDASELKSGYAELSLQARARAGSWGDAYGELRVRSGLEWGERFTELDLREAYVNLFLGPVDVRVGQQIVAWGRADGFNPTDNLTPRNMNVRSANEDDRRVANMAVRGWLNLQPVRLELVWVPFFEPSRFPNFALPGPLNMVAPNYPDQNITKGIGAARLNLETAAFEGSLSYLVGHATFPGLRLHEVSVGIPPPMPPTVDIQVGFSAYRHQVAGFDFATTVGDWLGLRGEVAYQLPFDWETRNDVPLPNLAYVLGVDGEPVTNVSIVAQYVGRYAFEWEELAPSRIDELSTAFPIREALDYPGGPVAFAEDAVANEIRHKVRAIYNQQEQISHAASLRIAWTTLHETLTLEMLGYYGFTMGDYMLRPKISYAIADAINLYVGGEIYGGGDDSLYGLVDETLSAGFVELRASF